MKPARKHLIAAALLAAVAAVATAQTAAPASGEASAAKPKIAKTTKAAKAAKSQNARRSDMHRDMHKHGAHREGRGERSPEQMAERHSQRMAELKKQLNITPAQEAAWARFAGAMQPPQPPAGHDSRAERGQMQNLNTAQRADAMQKREAERHQHMQQRSEALKAFYAQLTPAQQKVMDERRGPDGRHGMGGERRGRGESRS